MFFSLMASSLSLGKFLSMLFDSKKLSLSILFIFVLIPLGLIFPLNIFDEGLFQLPLFIFVSVGILQRILIKLNYQFSEYKEAIFILLLLGISTPGLYGFIFMGYYLLASENEGKRIVAILFGMVGFLNLLGLVGNDFFFFTSLFLVGVQLILELLTKKFEFQSQLLIYGNCFAFAFLANAQELPIKLIPLLLVTFSMTFGSKLKIREIEFFGVILIGVISWMLQISDPFLMGVLILLSVFSIEHSKLKGIIRLNFSILDLLSVTTLMYIFLSLRVLSQQSALINLPFALLAVFLMRYRTNKNVLSGEVLLFILSLSGIIFFGALK